MELFKKEKSKFYWYDFMVGGRRYRGSTQEVNRTRAAAIAAIKMCKAIEGKDPLPRRAPVLNDFAKRFLAWVDEVKLEAKTKTYCRRRWFCTAGVTISGRGFCSRPAIWLS